MGLTIAKIKAKLNQYMTITSGGFADEIYVTKFSTGVENNSLYKGHGTKTYDDPVETIGRVIIEPSDQVASLIGSTERFDAAFLWTRDELVKQFPTLGENLWITTNDIIVFNMNEYNLFRVYPTGKVQEECLLFIGLALTPRGKKRNAP